MARGRVAIAGPLADRRLDWLRRLLRRHGYETVAVGVDVGNDTPQPISPTPIVAGFDMRLAGNDERFASVAVLDDRVPPSQPLLTLCQAVSVDEVASYTVHTERVIGISVFGPRRENMLVELVPGLGTESGTVRRSAELLATLGLRTEVLPPGLWAVQPRVLSMIVNEAAVALSEGVASAAEIDAAMRLGANYPAGPLALADEIGLDEIVTVLDALHGEFGDDRYRVAPLLRRMVLAGYTGVAAGRGFHLYP
jgi:3-hydroxybutyryl-CoA dehydrogenase